MVDPYRYYGKANMTEEEKRQLIIKLPNEPIPIGYTSLRDILPREKDLTIFMDYVYLFGDIVEMLGNPNETFTIFAPTNSVFRNLPYQPTSNISVTEDPTTKLHNFVLGHIVEKNLISLSVGEELQTMYENVKIKVDKDIKDEKYLLNGNIHTSESYKADNGIFYKKVDGNGQATFPKELFSSSGTEFGVNVRLSSLESSYITLIYLNSVINVKSLPEQKPS
nr:12928_t:CDS:2 [Entrophospora candida]